MAFEFELPLISCLPMILFAIFLLVKEAEATKVLLYLSCLPLLAWISIVLSCVASPDRGYTSLGDYILCPREIPVRRPEASTVVVVGASRGLGRALVARLVAAGYFVIGTVRRRQDAEALENEFGKHNVFPVFLEMTDHASVRKACEEIACRFRGDGDPRDPSASAQEQRRSSLAAVVFVAGITSMGPFEGIPFDKLSALMETNVLGTMHVVHRLLPVIRAHRARVVVTGAPDVPLPQYVIKSACNGALLAFARALRTDLWGLGVSVSLVQPAATRGGMVLQAPALIARTRAEMPAPLRRVYPPGFRLLRGATADFGFDPAWAVRAYEHAIASPRPKTRYTTTPPGTVLYFLSFLLPDRLLEMALFKGPFGPGGLDSSEAHIGESERGEEEDKAKVS